MTDEPKEKFEEVIAAVEVIHRKGFTPLFDGRQRYARMVVWATTNSGKRVWTSTVEGDLDPMNVEIKVAMAQEFFSGLVGHSVSFHEDHYKNAFFVEEQSLPKKFRVSYPELKEAMREWVKVNCSEELARLRKEKAVKAATTRKKNAEEKESWRKRKAASMGLSEDASWKQIEQAEEQARNQREELEKLRRAEELKERRANATHLSFTRGRNPKTGNDQWQTQFRGYLCVLCREDSYVPADGEIPVEGILEFPGRIMLVKRI